ncbi:MAG: diaminopimelate epimerase [Gemmatimonadota bacterium]|nr:MAG: diaminopimelate epimerase [Gemmatimonadota bacterium]
MEQTHSFREIPFTKMVGTGNDFILIDNRQGLLSGDVSSFVRRVCARRVSVGADGLLLLERSGCADFKMRYFNADGGEAEFWGNGARCIALYAVLNGISGDELSFESRTGLRRAQVNGGTVSISMPDPRDEKLDLYLSGETAAVSFVRVGVPHVVLFVDRVDDVDVVRRGRAIREMDQFRPEGTNVNFVQILEPGLLKVRTYERGVENETYSCGTGVCASALIAHRVHGFESQVKVLTRTGDVLTVSFNPQGGHVEQCTLTGEAQVIYRGIFIFN